MKISRRNIVSASLTNAEVEAFEQWGTAHDYNVNRALRAAIAHVTRHQKAQSERKQEAA